MFGPVNPLWGLSVEEQFYLSVLLVTRLGGRRTLSYICGCTIVVSYVVLAWLGHHGAVPIVTAWANSFVQFQFFAVGGLIALSLYGKKFAAPMVLRCLMVATGFALWQVASTKLITFDPSTAKQLLSGYFIVLTATTLIFLSVLDTDAPILTPISYLRKISYGLYLFHEFAIELIFRHDSRWLPSHLIREHQLIAAGFALCFTIGLATVSYQYFERPIFRYKEHFERVLTREA